MDGFLCVDKPPATTSRDIVNRVQRLVRPTKVGHAGTLDPLATGVLVVALGKATRLVPFVQRMEKEYVAEFTLGKSSDTEDITGHVVDRPVATPPSDDALRDACQRYTGCIQQRPPQYSALRVGGKRAYQYARRGERVVLAAREVVIHRLDILSYVYPRLEVKVLCGSGTYIRSLGRDIGEQLGCGAVMSQLRRTRIGDFRVDAATAAGELLDRLAIQSRLLPLVCGVQLLTTVTLDESQLTKISYGSKIGLDCREDELAAINPDGDLAAVLRRSTEDTYRPAVNFMAR